MTSRPMQSEMKTARSPRARTVAKRLGGMLTAGVVLASGLVLGGTTAASANTQTVTEAACSGDSLVQHDLMNGSSWEFCWRIDSYRGLILDKVAFRPRDDARPILVLDSISLSQLNVPYDTGRTEFNDVTTYQVGGPRLQEITAIDCPEGEVRDAFATSSLGEIPAVCITEENSGIAYRSNIPRDGLYAAQGTDLVINMVSRIGWYEYVVEYRMHDDGEMNVRLGATGDLSPNDYAENINHGWPIGEGQTDFSVSHYHSAFWRVDFAIDGGEGQVIEKFTSEHTGEYGTTGDTGRTPIIETTVETIEDEQKLFVGNREMYRVVNPNSLNDDGHPRSYSIEMASDRAYALNPETDYDIAFTQSKADEVHASYNLIPTKPNYAVTDYIDGDALENPVAWVNVGFHHINRDEDQSPMPIHWQDFTLYPRDWSAQNPIIPEGRKWVNGDMRGVPNPNIPAPTPTPTPEPTEPEPEPTAPGEGEPGDGDPGEGPGGGAPGGGSGDPEETPAASVSFGSSSVVAGGTQTVTATGFQPGEMVDAVLHSDPVVIGSFPTDNAGDLNFQFVVPDVEAGEHTLVLTGVASGITGSGTFTVEAPAGASIVGQLGATGTDANLLAMLGSLLLLVGAGFGIAGWRRRGAEVVPGTAAATTEA